MNAAEFARLSGVSTGTLSRILRGQRLPSWATIQAIEAATKGRVGPDAWRQAA
tara:strand:- start:659 stop:817 length:159 start_codon:yes stop_codon:yes gene_type:complete